MMAKLRIASCVLAILLFCSCAMSVSALTPMVKWMYGDVDHDFTITTTDARLVLQYCAGKANYIHEVLADVDGDGEVTTTDARLILQHSLQKRNYSCIGEMQEWVYPEGWGEPGVEPYLKKPKLRWRW
ncbi:MAG: dockerin type I repeat-containing protein [Clostridia bacterium]|nr:dockerin type I repeat-containing protein [Clostridia bacterium]